MRITIGFMLALAAFIPGCGGGSSGNDASDTVDVVEVADDGAGPDADTDADADADGDADAEADACVPIDCTGRECGDDGCGGTCGTGCGTGHVCSGSGTCDCPSAVECGGACCAAGDECDGSSACCTPETDAEFCTSFAADCGAVSHADNCGVARTVDECGSCPTLAAEDGVLDGPAVDVAGTATTMHLWAARWGDVLYVATDAPGMGSDHFLFVSPDAPSATTAAPWAKSGTVPFGSSAVFLAAENDSSFAGWFALDDVTLLEQAGSDLSPAFAVGRGAVVEGSLDLVAVFGARPAEIYVAVGAWATPDGGALYSGSQAPPTVNGDGNVDADEVLALDPGTLDCACDDGDACTTDSCSADTHRCTTAPVYAADMTCSAAGLSDCRDVTHARICTADADSCFYWEAVACSGGLTCWEGDCTAVCHSDTGCTSAGLTRCTIEHLVQTCLEIETGCFKWGVAAECDDGNPCNGIEACDGSGGCLPGTPPGPGVSCTATDDLPGECRSGRCILASCGDRRIDDGELCDEGLTNSDLPDCPSGCRLDCTPMRCGDGIRDTGQGERCDDGPDNGRLGYCRTDCSGLVS